MFIQRDIHETYIHTYGERDLIDYRAGILRSPEYELYIPVHIQ